MRFLPIFLLAVCIACGALVGCRTTTPQEWEQMGLTPEDGKIQNQIVQQIRGEPSLVRYPIQVSVRQGVATLRGTVNSVSDAMRAYAIAKAVPGVIRVDNKLVSP